MIYRSKKCNNIKIHFKLINIKIHTPLGITYPNGQMQKRLLLEVYNEANVDASKVAYMELHGTGTKAGDPEETNAAAEVFCTAGQ